MPAPSPARLLVLASWSEIVHLPFRTQPMPAPQCEYCASNRQHTFHHPAHQLAVHCLRECGPRSAVRMGYGVWQVGPTLAAHAKHHLPSVQRCTTVAEVALVGPPMHPTAPPGRQQGGARLLIVKSSDVFCLQHVADLPSPLEVQVMSEDELLALKRSKYVHQI
jgi:hypothetical protein